MNFHSMGESQLLKEREKHKKMISNLESELNGTTDPIDINYIDDELGRAIGNLSEIDEALDRNYGIKEGEYPNRAYL